MPIVYPGSVFPQTVTGPDGVRYVSPHPYFIAGSIVALNDGLDTWPPGAVIVTGINPPTWRAGRLSSGEEPGQVNLPGELCILPTSYDLGHTFLGICLGNVEPGQWATLATHGSIVPVRCRDASSDTALALAGTWLRWSADLDTAGLSGNVESVTVADLVSASDSVSMPGSIVGQVVVPAGTTGSGDTGSNYYVIARISPR